MAAQPVGHSLASGSRALFIRYALSRVIRPDAAHRRYWFKLIWRAAWAGRS